MSLIGLVIVLIVVGVLLWAANTYIPMDPKIKTIMNVVVVIAVILWLLSAFGVLGVNGHGPRRPLGNGPASRPVLSQTPDSGIRAAMLRREHGLSGG